MERVLITGGTGSFGKAFIRHILANKPEAVTSGRMSPEAVVEVQPARRCRHQTDRQADPGWD